MSNLVNEIIQEQIWETILDLYSHDYMFAGDVSYVTFKRDHCHADELEMRNMETLGILADEIWNKLGEGLIDEETIIYLAKRIIDPMNQEVEVI